MILTFPVYTRPGFFLEHDAQRGCVVIGHGNSTSRHLHFIIVDSVSLISFKIFTHKTPFEGVPMPHGLVAFLVQGTTPIHPNATSTEGVSIPAPSRPPLKRRRTPAYPMPASSSDALEEAANAAAAAIPSEEEGLSAARRGLCDEMWSLLQLCWKYEPRARPTMETVIQSLKKIVGASTAAVKNITACVRKVSVYPVATGGQCDVCLFCNSRAPADSLTCRYTSANSLPTHMKRLP